MIDNASLQLFLLASFALLVIPGPAVLYIVARSIEQGRIAGVVSVLGIGMGGLVHVLAAALGLSALLVSSALAFTIVKYLGAAYLIYLGITTVMKPNKLVTDLEVDEKSLAQVFRQGMIVNILNPKTALFFFAFLPQFVEPTGSPVALQIAFLGALFVSMAIITDGIYAIIAGTLGQWLKRNHSFQKAQKYLSGSIYILLGAVTALSGSKNH